MIYRIRLFIIILMANFSFLVNINAVEMNDLYSAKVEVAAQSYQERQKAYHQAIEMVFVRISGNRNIIEQSLVKEAIANPTRYLSQYQFQQLNNKLFLDAQFNEKAINQVIKQSGETIWGTRRPQILWWLALDDNTSRKMIGDGEKTVIPQIIQTSKNRGLPFVFPLLDFEDQMQVNLTDVWGRFSAPIMAASERYNAEAIVIGRLFKQINQDSVHADTWFAQLSLLNSKQVTDVTLSAAKQDELIQACVNWLADQLAEKYSIKANGVSSEYLFLTVENLTNSGEAVVVQDFLSTISAIDTVQLYQINEFGVQYKLGLIGEAIDVLDALAFDNRIEKIKPLFGQENNMQENVYRWKGKIH